MTEKTPMEKLAGVRMEIVTLLPRVTPEIRKNLEICKGWLNDIEQHMTIIDADDDDAGDGDDMATLIITCEDDTELDTICNVIQEAEAEGAIDFSFGVERK